MTRKKWEAEAGQDNQGPAGKRYGNSFSNVFSPTSAIILWNRDWVTIHSMDNSQEYNEAQPLNIGIVGSGIAGLAAGYLLNQRGHQVTVFEKQATLGMDAHSLDWQAPPTDSHESSPDFRLDVPPRLFNPELWPNLVELYHQAGIETCRIDPSKSFSDEHGSFLALPRGYRPTLSNLLSRRVQQIAEAAGRLQQLARQWQTEGTWPSGTMAELWNEFDFPAPFVQDFLYPALGSTVCTCTFQDLDNYPVSILLPALLAMMEGSPLHRTVHGSQDVVSRLSRPLQIQLNHPVQEIHQDRPDRIRLQAAGRSWNFDHVIVATQANHVGDLVRDLAPEEKRALASIRYSAAPVVIHTDTGLMPTSRKAWSHFNIFVDKSGPQHRDCRGMCTIWMKRFYDLPESSVDIFQTILPFRMPAEDKILGQSFLQRPVVTLESFQAWEQLEKWHQQQQRRLWFCGSYAVGGIPLLESGVASAARIVAALDRHSLRSPAGSTR